MSDKDPKEWKEQLTPEQYEVCINHGTEPPFSGKYNEAEIFYKKSLEIKGRTIN